MAAELNVEDVAVGIQERAVYSFYLTALGWGEFEKKPDLGSRVPRTWPALWNSVSVEGVHRGRGNLTTFPPL